MLFHLLLLLARFTVASKHIIYLTGQHNVVPSPSLVSSITHVSLAFMPSSLFNEDHPASFPLFTDVATVRSQFAPGTKVVIAIGGWSDTEGFAKAAGSEEGRERFAENVKRMVDLMEADGVDIDWEYPGGNGEDYKRVPNTEKAWEIEAYPLLLSRIRSSLGPHKLISAAVPGLRRDQLAFTKASIPLIDASLDFWNIMTYDLMNRRDNITKHHTGAQAAVDAVDAYLEGGVRSEKAMLGFAFYVKWFRTTPDGGCENHPVGCKTALMEDPLSGDDLGQAGQFAWCDPIPTNLATSFEKALKGALWDDIQGGNYYFDASENIFWSWDAPYSIEKKLPILLEKKLGGVFAWGLGEDGERWERLRALNWVFEELEESRRRGRGKDEL